MLSHNNILANSLTAMLNMDIRDDSVHLHVSPMFHVAGGARIFHHLAGGRHVVIPRFEPGPFLKTLEGEGVTITIIVPTMLARLMRAVPGDHGPFGPEAPDLWRVPHA